MTEDYCYKNEIIEVLYIYKKRFYTVKFIYFNDTTDKESSNHTTDQAFELLCNPFLQIL